MNKNGKSVASRQGGHVVATHYRDNVSAQSSGANASNHTVSSQRDIHQPGEIVDPTDNHHSLEKDQGLELEEEQDLLQDQGIFELANGYIYYCKEKPTLKAGMKTATPLPDANSPLDPANNEDDTPQTETTKTGGGPTFQFVGRKANNAIHLFGNQMFKMIRELRRNAYKAYDRSDDTYQFVVTENKTHRVTLEVSLYQDKTYLFLKRYWKNLDGHGPFAGMMDPDTWLPTKGVVSLDPHQDDPVKMLRFVLRCCH